MSPSIWQILLVVVLIVVLFGRGKISALMGDVAKGIGAFKRGMRDADKDDGETDRAIDAEKSTIDMAASESRSTGTTNR